MKVACQNSDTRDLYEAHSDIHAYTPGKKNLIVLRRESRHKHAEER